MRQHERQYCADAQAKYGKIMMRKIVDLHARWLFRMRYSKVHHD